MDSKVVWTDYPCLFPETIPKPSRSFANCLEEKKRTPSHRAAGPDKDKATGASHKAKRFCVSVFPDFVIAYPKKYKSYNFSRQECKKQGFSRIGGRACYFTRLFARLPKQQKQPLIIKHLQTYFEKVTKSGERATKPSVSAFQCFSVSIKKKHAPLLPPPYQPIP